MTFEGREGLFTTVERGQRLGGFLQSRPSNERTNGQFSSRLTPPYQSQHIHTDWLTCYTHSLTPSLIGPTPISPPQSLVVGVSARGSRGLTRP